MIFIYSILFSLILDLICLFVIMMYLQPLNQKWCSFCQIFLCFPLVLQNAGNKAFQCGKHTEAVEHYTAAILNSVESRPFAAVCFCNRAAAHQALGKISDAIADCSLAIALDGSYGKVCLFFFFLEFLLLS